VMSTDVLTVDPRTTTAELYEQLPEGTLARRQRLYPVLETDGGLLGVLAWSDVLAANQSDRAVPVKELARRPLLARPEETLRAAADRMVFSGHGMLPVVEHGRLLGLVSQFDLLKAHERVLVEERHRERPLGPRQIAQGPRPRRPAHRQAR
jgi:predicted transcriptional regulator